ncbi:hypothetical protein Tcan_00114, partial [Toxocara canis]
VPKAARLGCARPSCPVHKTTCYLSCCTFCFRFHYLHLRRGCNSKQFQWRKLETVKGAIIVCNLQSGCSAFYIPEVMDQVRMPAKTASKSGVLVTLPITSDAFINRLIIEAMRSFA